jgi:hypothetical protein
VTDNSTAAPDDARHTLDSSAGSAPPKWSTWSEAIQVVLYPAYLRKTVAIAILVGTVLFAINQLDVVVRGDATPLVWAKAAVTYLVPFCVSNAGVLVASRRRRESSTSPGEAIAQLQKGVSATSSRVRLRRRAGRTRRSVVRPD